MFGRTVMKSYYYQVGNSLRGDNVINLNHRQLEKLLEELLYSSNSKQLKNFPFQMINYANNVSNMAFCVFQYQNRTVEIKPIQEN